MMTRTTTRMANSQHPAANDSYESILGQTHIDSPEISHVSGVPPRQTAPTTAQVTIGQTSSSRLINPRRLSIAALCLAPLVGIPPLAHVLVDHVAPTLANAATTNLDRLFAWRQIQAPEDVDDVTPERTTPFEVERPEVTSNDTPNNPRHNATPNNKNNRGVIVRADAVVRAVQSGGRPTSVPVAASGTRPAGLSLVGVSHFGTGIHDGDILTSVGGTPATSEGTVIAIVAGAISQGAKVITGVVWRDEQRMDVAVEIPGPEAFAKPRRKKRRSVHDQ